MGCPAVPSRTFNCLKLYRCFAISSARFWEFSSIDSLVVFAEPCFLIPQRPVIASPIGQTSALVRPYAPETKGAPRSNSSIPRPPAAVAVPCFLISRNFLVAVPSAHTVAHTASFRRRSMGGDHSLMPPTACPSLVFFSRCLSIPSSSHRRKPFAAGYQTSN
jgi:hypothetical protein